MTVIPRGNENKGYENVFVEGGWGGGGVGANKVHYAKCVSGVLMNRRVNSKGNSEKLNVFPMLR